MLLCYFRGLEKSLLIFSNVTQIQDFHDVNELLLVDLVVAAHMVVAAAAVIAIERT